MATTTPYRAFQGNIGNASINLDADTFKVMLASSDYDYQPTLHATTGDITDLGGDPVELAGSGGYTTGGATLANTAWAYNATVDRWVFSCDPVLWSPATFTFQYAIVYAAVSGLLVAVTDYVTEQVFAAEDCRLSWPDGVVRSRLVTS